MFGVVRPIITTVVALPMVTLVVFVLASHAAVSRRRVWLALLTMLVIAVGEWNLPLGVLALAANGILVRHDLWRTWQQARSRLGRNVAPPQVALREMLQQGWFWLGRLAANLWGIGRVGGIRRWLAAQCLRLALALSPHDWCRDLPRMRGIIGIPVRRDDVCGAWPTLDEAATALQGIQVIVDRQNDAPTEPDLPVIVSAK